MKDTNTDCPSTWPGCARHGDCHACKQYHHTLGQKTACEKQVSK